MIRDWVSAESHVAQKPWTHLSLPELLCLHTGGDPLSSVLEPDISMSLLMIHPKICSLGWIRCPTETHRAPGENTYQDLKSAKSQPVILESYKGKRKCQCSLSAGFRPLFKKSYYSFHRMCATAVSFSSPFKTNWNFDTWSPQILGVRRIEENPPGCSSCFP